MIDFLCIYSWFDVSHHNDATYQCWNWAHKQHQFLVKNALFVWTSVVRKIITNDSDDDAIYTQQDKSDYHVDADW